MANHYYGIPVFMVNAQRRLEAYSTRLTSLLQVLYVASLLTLQLKVSVEVPTVVKIRTD